MTNLLHQELLNYIKLENVESIADYLVNNTTYPEKIDLFLEIESYHPELFKKLNRYLAFLFLEI